MAGSPTRAAWFIRARLKPRQLQLIAALGREGNIHRAAEALGIAQPAASKLLKDLEEALQIELFERLPRGMRATRYGEALIRHAEVAIGALNDAGGELEALRAGRAGRVAIGAIGGPAVAVLPKAVSAVKRAHPMLTISIQVDSSDVLMEGLARGALDMLVARITPGDGLAALRYERLADEPVCAIARPEHPLAGRADLTLADLQTCGWIVPPRGSVLRHRLDLSFREAGVSPPTNIVESSAFPFVTTMLQQTDCVAVTSVDVARHYERHGLVAILPLPLSCTMDAFGLITRDDRAMSPSALIVVAAVREAASGVYGAITPDRETVGR